jgi:hypothetical protein
MNRTRRNVSAGIAAVIAGLVSLGAGLDVNAADRPAPNVKKQPAPAVVLAGINYRHSPGSHTRQEPATVVDGYNRPSPGRYKVPTPSVVWLPCPAADDIPECNLHRASETATSAASAKALRTPAVASAGVGGTISPTRMTPSPR